MLKGVVTQPEGRTAAPTRPTKDLSVQAHQYLHACPINLYIACTFTGVEKTFWGSKRVFRGLRWVLKGHRLVCSFFYYRLSGHSPKETQANKKWVNTSMTIWCKGRSPSGWS